ncbi:MAG: hypothetical protein ACOYIA_00445 [Eubacteriales bacterium]|jgi:hypothetical protein
MKRLIPVIISALLIFWSLTLLPASAAEEWIPISTPQELADIGKNLSGNYYLTQNIDLTGFEWDSIGTDPFKGVLDGNGFIIMNLSCESYMNRVGGLFMQNEGTIKNLCLYNFSITAKDVQYDNVGAICGVNYGIIDNCHVYGTINNPVAQYVGMISGLNYGTITNCSTAGSIKAAYHVGGLAGQNRDLGTIQNCVNYTSITIAHNRAGGIAGTQQTNTGAEYCILNCINYGDIIAEPCTDSDSHGSAGGIVGHYQKDNCPVVNSITFGQLTGKCCFSATVGNPTQSAIESVENCYYLAGCQTNTAVINPSLEKGTEFTLSNVGSVISKLGDAFAANTGIDSATYPIIITTFWGDGFSSYHYYDARELAAAVDLTKPAAVSTTEYKPAETTPAETTTAQPDETTTAPVDDITTYEETTAPPQSDGTTTARDTTKASTDGTKKSCKSVLGPEVGLISAVSAAVIVMMQRKKRR